MMINLTELKNLIKVLVESYTAEKKCGKRDCDIKIRLDCIIKGLMRCVGTVVEGKSEDFIVEL